MAIKLLIADDQEVVRHGLKNFMAGTDIQVVAAAKDGEEALRLASKHDLDVVLLDVRMPGGDGLEALGRIKVDRPDLPVVMFSAYNNPMFVARAMATGAAGYVLKGDSKAKLLETIRAAADGEETFTRKELRRVSGAMATPRLLADIEAPLSKREGEVLRLVATGMTNKKIAAEMKISHETVKEHVQHVLRKIGVSDRTQAALWAVRRGLG